jgi:hypothetical protein
MSDTMDRFFHRSLSETVTSQCMGVSVTHDDTLEPRWSQRKASCDGWPLMKGFEDKRSLKALITFD